MNKSYVINGHELTKRFVNNNFRCKAAVNDYEFFKYLYNEYTYMLNNFSHSVEDYVEQLRTKQYFWSKESSEDALIECILECKCYCVLLRNLTTTAKENYNRYLKEKYNYIRES